MILSLPEHTTTPQHVYRNRNWLLIGITFVIVILLALITLPPLLSLRDEQVRARLGDLQDFANALTIAETELQQLQSNVRGYLITQAPVYAEQYRATQDSLPANLQRLTELSPQVAAELEPQVAELIAVIERWQTTGGDRQVALVDQGRMADAAAEVAAGESQALFEALRTRINDLRKQAQTLQSDYQAQLGRARTLQFAVITGLGLLGLLALGFVIIGFRRMLLLTQAIDVERERTATLAEQVRAQLDTTERRNHQLTLLNAVAVASAEHMQRAQRAQSILSAITSTLALPVGAVWLAQKPGGPLAMLADVPVQVHQPILADGNGHTRHALPSVTQPTLPMPATPPIISDVIAGGRPTILTVPDVQEKQGELADLAYTFKAPIRSAAVIPLHGRKQPIGALLLADSQPGRFAADDVPFFATLAASVGLALENALLFEEAQTERQRLQTIFDHSPEGIILVEAPANQIVLANHTAAALFGPLPPGTPLIPHPLAGRVFRPGGEPCPEDDLPLTAVAQGNDGWYGRELMIEQPDGQRVPVLLTSIPLYDDDGLLRGAVAVFQDLRQLREVERLKSDFVALVSHELRTPLTTIKGCTQTLLRGYANADPARTREFLEIIDRQGERLQELIENLLNLSQLDAGALRLRRELVELQPLAQGLLRQLRERLHDVRLQADLPAGLPLISADERRIEQVLINLIENAHKFSPPGGVITISAEPRPNEVIVSVRDQGPGIAPTERERVFERFYQAQQPKTRQVGGTGLGLAICKALVEAHGGRIWIEGAPGGGTCVRFTIPALPIDKPPSPGGSANVLVRQEVGGTRILVVDDDPAMRRLLEVGLTDAGYRVQMAAEAQAALDAATRQAPDLILLDLMLPGMDGFALCRQLREWTNVPIIMLTAQAAERDLVLGLQLGADDYVTKPFRLNELIARIEAVLRRTQGQPMVGGVSYIQTGDLTIDLAQRRVSVRGAEVSMTPTEYAILAYLAQHIGQILTHEQILKAVWGDTYGAENNYLWVHIAHLRQKIEADPKQPHYILTERGVGYRLRKA